MCLENLHRGADAMENEDDTHLLPAFQLQADEQNLNEYGVNE